ncbi:MAG TPA: SDR family oxidoreductase [Stellaceae bacterium]|nr:SDR family oxidoreductase [Stellaceae bacterium]
MPTILITGANRGLGLEFARQYVADGWRVIATSRVPDKGDALKALGPRVSVERLDVADLAATAALGRALAAETIDIVIANAGISAGRDMTAATVAAGAEAWERTFRVNAVAPLALAGAFHAQVARSEQRKMIAITSRLGSMGANSDGGLYAYRSSKAALNAVWRSFALDHPDVIAALLHPGWVRTDMGGRGALLDPEQSVAGLRRVIANLGKADSGRFYNYDGSPIPW